jgi:signal transduction histidine kinase/AmiR/NasT family two-component response regulator
MGGGKSSAETMNSFVRTGAYLGLTATLTFCLTYLILAASHLSFDIITLWPVDGLTLGLMIGRMGRRPYLTLVISKLGVLAAGLCSGHPLFLSLAVTVLYGTATGVIYHFCKSFDRRDWYSSSKILLRFIMFSGVVSFILCAIQALLLNRAVGVPLLQSFMSHVTGDTVGYILFTPLVAIFTQVGIWTSFDEVKLLRSTRRLVLYTLALAILFSLRGSMMIYTIPLGLMLIAYIEDLPVVAVALSLTTVIAVLATNFNAGPFQLITKHEDRDIALEVFLAIITVTMLPIAASMAEHERLKQSLIVARTEADAANHAKSMFLATMSHEIRTPLNGVLGMAQVIAMDELSPVQRERVGVVRRSGEALLSILNDVLDISKIEAGKLTLEAIEFNLGETMRSAAQSYESLAKETGLEVKLDLGGVEGVYLGDPTRVRQILYNLMSNAFKFTAQGSITLAAAYGDGVLQLTVSDTGIGIPAEKLDRLFGKFSQVDASTTRKFGGSGLGLSICRELTSLMGGTIEVESEEGCGSEFKVRLPMERISETATADPEHDTPICNDMSTLRVLAAEDNPTNQLVLKTLLQFAEVDVVIVENGAQALEAWSAQAWDLILMDVQMPVMDGPTATREIRRREAEQRLPRTPIIALTANTMSHQIAEYMAAGMDGHIAKPIEADALFQALSSIGDAGEPQTALTA